MKCKLKRLIRKHNPFIWFLLHYLKIISISLALGLCVVMLILSLSFYEMLEETILDLIGTLLSYLAGYDVTRKYNVLSMDNHDPQEGSSTNPQGTKRTGSDAGLSDSASPKRVKEDDNDSTKSNSDSHSNPDPDIDQTLGLDPNLLPFDEEVGNILDSMGGIAAVVQTHGDARAYFNIKGNSITNYYNNAISDAQSTNASEEHISSLVSTRNNLLAGLNQQRVQIQDDLESSTVPSDASVTSGEEMGNGTSSPAEAGGEAEDSPQNSGESSSDSNPSDF